MRSPPTMTEILVHIAAPATRRFDDMCRSLANAYHDFEPFDSGRVEAQEVRIGKTGIPPNLQVGPGCIPRHSSHISDNVALSTSSKDSYGSFPSHVLPETQQQISDVFPSLGSFESINDSLHDTSRLAQLERIQTNWREKREPEAEILRDRRKTVRKLVSLGNKDITFIEDSQLAALAIESQLPETFAAPGDTADDSSSHEFSIEGPILSCDPNSGLDNVFCFQQPSNTIDSGLIPTVNSTSKIASRGKSGTKSSPPLENTLHHLEVGTPRTSDRYLDVAGLLESALLYSAELPTEIFPPSPDISVERPGILPSQLTQYLSAIQQENPGVFQPTRTRRSLATDERGYWLVESAKWPRRMQYEFWFLLCDHVRNGQFGWGVSLHRKPIAYSVHQVRLYCWGEIAEHIWLSIWLCSKGNVIGSGSKWLDAEEEVVIEVP